MTTAHTSMLPVVHADEETRAGFLVRVYQHIALAVVAFMAIEFVLFNLGIAEAIANFMAGNAMGWLLLLGGFTIVSALATSSAHDLGNPSKQYGALFAMAGAEALIFAPFLYWVFARPGGSATVISAAVVTVIGFAALTVVGMITRRDLSPLRPLLIWGGVAALGLIVAALLFGFELGPLFSVAMIGLAGASILYQTQNVVRRYPSWAFVGAAVSLFGSLMMMFWYILRLFIGRD